MAEEEVVAPAASPAPGDHKRKLDELEGEAAEHPDQSIHPNAEPDEPLETKDLVASDSSDAKRPRIDDKPDDLEVSENGFQAERFNGSEKEEKEAEEHMEGNKLSEDGATPSDDAQVTLEAKEVDAETVETAEHSTDNHLTGDTQQPSVDNKFETSNAEEPPKEETKETNDEVPHQDINENQTTRRNIEVPSSKVGVLIGKGGDTIRYLQYNSGAKIQITRDADADPNSLTRPVEIIGTLTSIEKAEKLINAVIAEADAGGSPSLVARGLPTTQAAVAADHIEIQVPNEKVGLIIGRGGENIKSMQTKSGARIQLIPQHLPEGDGSKERTVRVTGDRRQIEMARELIMDVMYQTVRPSPLSKQQTYRPRGPTGPPQWGQRGLHPAQSMPYDYQQRGPYPSQIPHYQPPSYGNYPPQQVAPRSSYGSGWEQRPPSMQGPPPHNTGYDYYGGQGGHAVSAPLSLSGHAPGPSPSPGMGPSSQANYNHGQPHGPEYGHPAPYSHTAQQSYGHMYEEPKYENHAPVQQPYAGYAGSQPGYQQAGGQPGYVQQQYGKPSSYGMQGPSVQTYGPPRPGQPGDMPYQGPAPSSQSYGPNVPPQQQYPYASSGSTQQAYNPYGAVQASDGYSQQPAATGQGYLQQSSQPVASYSQAGGQQAAAYGQVGSTGGYGSYPSTQQGYQEQPGQNSGSYGYQSTQDPSYGSGTASAYGAPAPSGQPGYAQVTPGQPGYEQSVSQPAYGATTPGTAPVSYGKTVSPQPAYPQYDSSQIYTAPR